MTSDVLQYLAFAQKSGTRSFSQFFAAMFQLVEGFALSPEEQHLRARLRYVRELFGTGVLESEGLEALDLAVPVDLVPTESRLDLAAIQARSRWVVVREQLMLHDLVGTAAESVATDASGERPVGPEEAPQSGARPSLAALARRHSSASRTDLRSDDPGFRFGHDDPFASLAKGDG